jgi:hypothetical protein
MPEEHQDLANDLNDDEYEAAFTRVLRRAALQRSGPHQGELVQASTRIMNAPSSIEDLLKGSLLYREAQAEREEVMKHKWYESEKKGYDIGFELALMDWRIKYGSQWHRERQSQHVYLRG